MPNEPDTNEPKDNEAAVIHRYMSAVAGKRRVEDKVCAECGKQFRGIRSARYCSGACRVRATRKRQAANAERS